MTSTSTPRQVPETIASPSDLATLVALRLSLGDEILSELLSTHLAAVDALSEELQAASRRADWPLAMQLACDVAAKSGELGFRAVTNAARSFAAAAADKLEPHQLRNGVQMVVFEHERLRLAIKLQFPELLV